MTIMRRTAAVLVLSGAGFSTAETAAVVAAASILTATAAPQIEEYVQNARAIKARGDVRVIAISIVRLTVHVQRLRLNQKVPPMLLVSEGRIPEATDPGVRPWAMARDDRNVQSLASHLVDNEAGYATRSSDPLRWQGPYLELLSDDPWGSRYAANVGLLERDEGHAVFVLSAGPNRLIETPFEAVGLKAGGDDVVGMIGRGR
jgi:hypothetical protein